MNIEKVILVSTGAITALIIGVIFITSSSVSNQQLLPRETCVSHGGLVGMHIHPRVAIYVEGVQEEVPSNIGIGATCMKAIHTHDNSGTLHIEYIKEHDFTLGDFFANWGRSIERVGYGVRVTSNGEEVEDYYSLILKDGQQIEIFYESLEQ